MTKTKEAAHDCREARKHNGWTNYETWLVALWIDNEQATYLERRDRAAFFWIEARPSPGVSKMDAAVAGLSEWLEETVKGRAPDLGASIWADLMNAAICEVNWREIARSWIDEAKADAEAA